MGLIYLDSVFCIYAVEGRDWRHSRALDAMRASAVKEFVITPLVKMECLVMPFRRGDHTTELEFRRFFDVVGNRPIPSEAYEHAARLRADHPSLRSVDALHLATAQMSGCTNLWTGDVAFAKALPGYVRNVFIPKGEKDGA